MGFLGKKIVITGASRGIGLEIAKRFRMQGAIVHGICKSEKSVDSVKEVCDSWHFSDFTKSEQLKECAAFVKNVAPDILINNAGINIISPFLDILPTDYLSIQQVNVFAPMLLCQAALPSMVKNEWGRIVNISSIWGKISLANRASYSASKFALDGLTLSLAAEFSRLGILANCISPGFIDTDLTRQSLTPLELKSLIAKVPAGRLGAVEEVAAFVVWLSSQENSFISGQNIAIDGGFTRV